MSLAGFRRNVLKLGWLELGFFYKAWHEGLIRSFFLRFWKFSLIYVFGPFHLYTVYQERVALAKLLEKPSERSYVRNNFLEERQKKRIGSKLGKSSGSLQGGLDIRVTG